MTIFQMLEQSGILALLGMGIVLSFLVIVILAVTAMGKIIRTIGLDKELHDLAQKATVTVSPGTVPNAAVTAAITAAVSEYRKNNS